MKLSSTCIALFLTLLFAACDKAPQPSIMKVCHRGNEYGIIEKGDMTDQGQPAHFIRYCSEKLFNESIRLTEQADILAVVAKHIDTNKHQRIVMIAVEKEDRLFGLMKPWMVRESVSAEKVLTYKPAATALQKLNEAGCLVGLTSAHHSYRCSLADGLTLKL